MDATLCAVAQGDRLYEIVEFQPLESEFSPHELAKYGMMLVE